MSIISRTHSLYQNRTSTPLMIVDEAISRVKTWDETVNAVAKDAFKQALETARAQTNSMDVVDFRKFPLFGIPCSIKECFAWKGMPHTSGLTTRSNTFADFNADVVQRVLDAGAIPICSTNLSELCMWMESHNTVYGRTNNPYDLSRTVGGSSGGEGAMVGSGCVPFGVGSDIGGSIRMPAFFCGVFGHKPTPGMVSNFGQHPNAYGEAQDYLCTGPLARSAEDIMPLLRVLSGSSELIEPSSVDLSNVNVYSVTGDGRRHLSKELREAQDKAAQHLSDIGMRVEETTIPEFKYSVEIWSAALEAAGGPTFRDLLFCQQSRSVLWELLKFVFGRSNHTFPALGLVLIEDLGKLSDQLMPFIERGRVLRNDFQDMLGTNSIMLYPSHATVAPHHRRALVPPWNWAYTAILNIMKVPVTQVPLGLNSEGLPLGVQVVGGPNHDHITIAASIELEKAFGGWIQPSRPG